jgi:hypothetical protein
MQSSKFARRIFALVLFAVLMPVTARAEVEKVEMKCEKGPCVKWFPKVTPPRAWHYDEDESAEQGVKVFAPDDMHSDMRMYTYAIQKTDKPALRTLDDVIVHEKENYKEGQAMEGKPLSTLDGKKLRTFLYATKGEIRWDQASYGEEGQFYVVFAITTNGLYELTRYVNDYSSFVGSYRVTAAEPPKQKPKAKQ